MRGEVEREDSLARRHAAWQAEQAAINQQEAWYRNATYVAEREAISQRLQKQELEVKHLREDMAVEERERGEQRRPIQHSLTFPSVPLPPSTAL